MKFSEFPMPISVRRAAAKSCDFSHHVGLRLPSLNSLKSMMIVLILVLVAGCSFHSRQWESAKALWAMRALATQPENETYWWNMEHEGETYRLFPVAWEGRTVLTDASRWLIVLQNSEIIMIRDFTKNQQIKLEVSLRSVVGGGEMGGEPSGTGRYLDSSFPGVGTEVLIVESSIGKPAEVTKTTTFCPPSRFDSQSLRLITRCTSGEKETELRMAEFDQSGNITSLHLNLLSNKIWMIYRSDDLVDAFGVKRYLDGDIDEI